MRETLDLKYRPKRFKDVVGNEHIISSLKHWLKKGPKRMPHFYIFSGRYGCGKTMLAYILANKLGCDSDLTFAEFNAANTRGIDTMRQIVEDARVPPMEKGKYKVFILDEVQQLTVDAQNALLKDTEFTTDWSFFIFCTTEPDKLVKALRSRATKYEVESLDHKQILEHLVWVCEQEGIKEKVVTEKVLKRICEVSDGSMRNALILLDQAASAKNEKDARKLIERGTKYDVNVWELCKILIMLPKKRRKCWHEALELLSELGDDAESIKRAVLWFLSDRIREMDDEGALELSKLIKLFSRNVFYGGKPLLSGMIVEACLGKQFEEESEDE